jgi:hypothetical protein
MNEDEQLILVIKGKISELSPDQAKACLDAADHIRLAIKQSGEGIGAMALFLVGAEYHAKYK